MSPSAEIVLTPSKDHGPLIDSFLFLVIRHSPVFFLSDFQLDFKFGWGYEKVLSAVGSNGIYIVSEAIVQQFSKTKWRKK